jgi:Domain of unknown function (DUF892)
MNLGRATTKVPAASQAEQDPTQTQGRIAMSVDTIEKLFIEELKDLYSAENQTIKALPKMVKAASASDLKKAFEVHLRETEGQIERLVEICNILGTTPKGKSCEGMKGVLEEGSSVFARDRGRRRKGCGPDRGCAARRTLRDGGLRHGAHVCGAAGAREDCQIAGRDAGRREGGGSETDLDCAKGQCSGAAKCMRTTRAWRNHRPA